jgi:hypothetical protein
MAKVPVITDAPVGRGALPSTFQRSSATPSAFGADIGRAVERIGGDIQQVQERKKREEDANFSLQAMNAFNDELRPFLDAPRTGIRSRVGSNAVGITDATDKKLNDLEKKYVKGLTNPAQKRAFKALISQRRGSVLNSITQREADQFKIFQDENTAAIKKGALEDVSNEPDNPEVIQNALIMTDTVIRANSAGKPAAVVDNLTEKAKSDIHTAAVYGMANKSALQAKEYYDQNKKNITAANRDKIEKALGNAVELQNIQIKTDEILAAGGNLEDWKKDAKQIKDPELRKGVEAAVEHEFQVQEAIRRDTERKVFNSEQAKVEKGLPFNPMAVQDPAKKNYLKNRQREVERKAVDPTYDTPLNMDKWGEWKAMGDDDKIKLSLEELTLQFRNSMDTSHWESTLNEWSALNSKAGRAPLSAKHASTLSFKDVAKSAGREANIIPRKKTRTKWSNEEATQFDAFERELDSRIKNWETNAGKKANSEQMGIIADEMVNETVFVDDNIIPEWMGGGDTKIPASVVNPDDRARAFVPIDDATDQETEYFNEYEAVTNTHLADAKKERLLAAIRMQDNQLIETILGEPNE